VTYEQLTLDLEPTNGPADLRAAIADLVREDGMTAPEREAVVADFLARDSDTVMSNGALRPRPCRCEPHGLPRSTRAHSRRNARNAATVRGGGHAND
jgi:hypothetical protein